MADPCQPLRSQVQSQQQVIQGLQAELQQAPTPEKPFLIRQIREAQQELAQLQAALAACVQTNPQPDAVVLTTATCPVCTDEQIRVWQHVVLAQLGVDGTDVYGHWIGGFPNDSKQFLPNINNWYPLGVEKRTLCGQLHHFNFYDGYGAEGDWNNFMIPTPAFRHLLEDAKIHGTSDEWHSCAGTLDCMEAEITPDESYYENVFNSKASGTSPLEGQVVCTYGPWVREWSHDNRPEIHPSELYWWRNQLPNRRVAYTLMQVQEDSNRFDREDDYDFGAPWDDPPSGWHAWSENPRTNRFRIAFELNPAATAQTFQVRRLESARVQTRWNDQTLGSTHDLQYNGKNVLRVEELLPNENHVGVAFSSICRNAANNRLQGYIALIATVGEGDRGGEGYQTLQVETQRPPFFRPEILGTIGEWPVLAQVERQTPGREVQVQVRPETLRRVEVDGKARLVGDVEVQVVTPSETGVTRRTVAATRVEEILPTERRELQLTPRATVAGRRAPGSTLEGVAVTAETRLEVTAAGETTPLTIPALALKPRIFTEAPQLFTDAPQAWSAMAAAAGGRAEGVEPPGSVSRARQWRLEVAPAYTPLRTGKASLTDATPFAEALNDVVGASDPQRVQELYGSAKPFRVTWSFKASNLTSGESVPVHRGAGAPPTAVGVEVGSGEKLNAELAVTFPQRPANAIVELVATARMRDTFGVTGTVRHRVWSHVLTATDRRGLASSMVRTAASLAAIAPDALEQAANLGGPVVDNENDGPRVVDLRSSRAAMVRLLAMDASQKQRITIGDLRSLVQGAKLFESTR